MNRNEAWEKAEDVLKNMTQGRAYTIANWKIMHIAIAEVITEAYERGKRDVSRVVFTRQRDGFDYLITYVWNRRGKDYNFESVIINESPAQWFFDIIKRAHDKGYNEDYHIVNVIEVSKDLAEQMKEHIG